LLSTRFSAKTIITYQTTAAIIIIRANISFVCTDSASARIATTTFYAQETLTLAAFKFVIAYLIAGLALYTAFDLRIGGNSLTRICAAALLISAAEELIPMF